VTLTYDDNGVKGNEVTLAKTFVTGANCTVSGATLTGGVNDTQKRVDVTNSIGYSLFQNAKRLVLHPTANAPENVSEDVILPFATLPASSPSRSSSTRSAPSRSSSRPIRTRARRCSTRSATSRCLRSNWPLLSGQKVSKCLLAGESPPVAH
jgi:hypothetical protein